VPPARGLLQERPVAPRAVADAERAGHEAGGHALRLLDDRRPVLGEREKLAAARIDQCEGAGCARDQCVQRRDADARTAESQGKTARTRDADAQAGERPGATADDDLPDVPRFVPRAREDLVHEHQRALRRVTALGARERKLSPVAHDPADGARRRAVQHQRHR
jgi:hypothetical protein